MKVNLAFSFGNQDCRVWRKSREASTLMVTGLKVIHCKPVPHFQNSIKLNFMYSVPFSVFIKDEKELLKQRNYS